MKLTRYTNVLSRILFALLFMVILHPSVFAEIFYLHDGQIIEGKPIYETIKEITIKTEFGNRTVRRSSIKRIKYEERKMEKIFILLDDGSIIKGYIADQDATKIYFKASKDDTKEKIILKSSIKQMSGKEITPLDVSINARIGLFVPLNSGDRNLKAAPCYLVGSGMNFPWINYSRIFLEAGYTKSFSSSDDKHQYLQFIPVSINGQYYIPFYLFHIIPKIGFGIAIADFDNGDGNTYRGMTVNGIAGLGIQYELIKRHFSASLWCDYMLLFDGKASMHSFIISGSVSYRF